MKIYTYSFLTYSLLATSLVFGSERELVIYTENEDAFAQWIQPVTTPKSIYVTKLPTMGEIKEVETFLKESPKCSGLEDNDEFYNEFIALKSELQSFKSTKLAKLNELALKFFISLHQHANNWLFEKAQDFKPKVFYDDIGNPEEFVRVSSVHAAYLKRFEKQFLIFQRVANRYFDILAKEGSHNLENMCGSTGYVKVMTSTTGIISKIRLGFIKDKNGYLPFRIIDSPSITKVEVNYGVPIIYGNQHFQRRILIENNRIISQSGFIISPCPTKKLPICFDLHCGTTFSTWSRSIYFNPGHGDRSLMEGLAAQLHGIVDYDDVQTNQKTHFVPFPTTEKENCVVHLMFLEYLIKVKNKHVIDALEVETGISVEELKDTVEAALLNECIAEVKQEIQLEKKAKVITNVPQRTQKKNAKQSNTKIVAKTASNQKEAHDEEILARAKKLMEAYKVEGRTKFSTVSTLLNNMLKDKESFKEAGVDLNHALKGFDVNITGSHMIVHKEGADTTSTLVKKHGKQDTDYYPREVNKFLQNIIVQICSHNFKGKGTNSI